MDKEIYKCYTIFVSNRNKGKIIIPANTKIWNHELFIAQSLANVGFTVKFLPENNRTRCPDAYVDGVLFEFKSPQGKNISSVERNLKRGIHQSENIALTSFRLKQVRDKNVQNFLAERLRKKHGIKKILFIDRQGKVIDINKII